ncbi:hypothetical protein BBJ28_00020216, partial [Nothophytophthora sp. Chile5]
MSVTLGVAAHASVQLRVLKLPELPPSLVTLLINPEILDGDSPAVVGSIRQAFQRWSSSTARNWVVSSGSILRFQLEDGELVEALAEVEYDTEETFSAKQLEDVPTGPKQQTLAKSQAKMPSISALDRSVLHLSRGAKAYGALMKAVRPILSRDAAACRVLLGTKPPGCALVHGERGSGKSTLLRSLVQALETSSTCLAYTTIVECRNLRGLKMESVKSRLSDLFEDAVAHAPAVIVLDNLDALVPEEDESAGAANEQSRRIAELLVVLMTHNCQRVWKATAELNASFKRECEAIKNLPDEYKKQARAKLLVAVGDAMQSKGVAVIAAARSDTSIHKALRGGGLFDRPIRVSSPDAERRETLIREMLHMKVSNTNSTGKQTTAPQQIVVDPSIDFGLLSSLTEGYSLRDLSSATDRSLHQMFKRCALLQPTKDADAVRKVQQNDFVEGIEDFQPTALIGVDLFKSSVKWSDVGGLQQVRTVLKDTLELPTR